MEFGKKIFAGIGDGMELLRGWVGWNGSDVGRVCVTAEMIRVSLGAISVSTLVYRINDTVQSPCYEMKEKIDYSRSL